jgi:hypothetical protein
MDLDLIPTIWMTCEGSSAFAAVGWEYRPSCVKAAVSLYSTSRNSSRKAWRAWPGFSEREPSKVAAKLAAKGGQRLRPL